MPVYVYKGIHAETGASCKGKFEAETERVAKQKLKKTRKIIVSDIREEASKSQKKGFSFSNLIKSPVPLSDISIMTRQFATLQEAHVPLDESLKALYSQVENEQLKKSMSEVKDLVSEGKSLAESLASRPEIFNRLYVNMVKAGESSGLLGTVLARLADFQEYQIKVRGQIVSAMTYPLIMIVAASGLVTYLFVSVVPKITKVFDNLDVKLPWYTLRLISVSEFMQNYWWLVLAFGLAGAALFRRWVATDKGRHRFDEFVLGLPMFGDVMLRVAVSRFTKTLSTLLSSGVPIIQSLEITRNVVNNSVISQVLEQAKIEVQEGKSLAACIDRSGRFPGLVVHMISTGEKTGQLEEMLAHVANAYDMEVERRITTMIAFIEPLMMIIMFAIVAVVIAAMMLPMMNIMSQFR